MARQGLAGAPKGGVAAGGGMRPGGVLGGVLYGFLRPAQFQALLNSLRSMALQLESDYNAKLQHLKNHYENELLRMRRRRGRREL